MIANPRLPEVFIKFLLNWAKISRYNEPVALFSITGELFKSIPPRSRAAPPIIKTPWAWYFFTIKYPTIKITKIATTKFIFIPPF